MGKRLTSLITVMVDTGLMVIAFANLLEIYIDSDKLIRDYNGHLLLHSSFKQTTIILYLLLLIISLASFLANSLAYLLSEKYYTFIGYKLVKWTTILHLSLAFILLAVQVKLWCSPPKLELNQEEWSSFVEDYDFSYYNYTSRYAASPLDRLQRALNCCGRKSPSEWIERGKKLIAPSCCSDPARRPLLVSEPRHGDMYYYCSDVDVIMNLFNAEALMGCQKRINARSTRFLFNTRVYLLVLMGVVFLAAKYSLIYHSPSCPQPSRSGRNQSASSSRAEPAAGGDATVKQDEEESPPDYWQAVGQAAP